MSLRLSSLVVVLLAAPAFATDPVTGPVVGFGEAVPSANGVSVEAYRAWISTLTAAKLSGKKVKIETQGVTVNRNTCLINGISLMD
jgi:hypothetical protein